MTLLPPLPLGRASLRMELKMRIPKLLERRRLRRRRPSFPRPEKDANQGCKKSKTKDGKKKKAKKTKKNKSDDANK
uniref:Uncharacterized protein n=1 Tax=Ditylenchus dipsaci TaxID=166011 RepID=A0A915DUH4_9BILA